MVKADNARASIQIQERDILLMQSLFESRIMTSLHLAIFHFNGSKDAANKRVYKLKCAGYLAEKSRRASEHSILFLTRKALVLLSQTGMLLDYPPMSLAALQKRTQVSDMTIRHELDVLDVKAAFYKNLRNASRFEIVEFNTWPVLNQFQANQPGYGSKEVWVKPDGFIVIREDEQDGGASEHTFFLEVDRSSETHETLISRSACYHNYFKSGEFATQNGGKRSDYEEFPFRALLVLKTEERRNNIAEKLLQITPPIFTLVYLSTFSEVINDPLGKIWIRPADYREATKNTRFDPAQKTASWPYKRQTERDFLVESRIRKFAIFSPNENSA